LQPRRALLQNRADLDKPRGGRFPAQRGERLFVVAAAEQRRAALRRGRRDQQVARERRQLAEHRADVLAAGIETVEQQQRRLGVAPQNETQQLRRLHVPGEAEHVQHLLRADAAARRRALVQQAQRVAQRPVGEAREQLRAVGLEVNTLLLRHVGEPRLDVARQDAPEREALAAGEDRGQHLVQLRRGEDEHQVLRRLLQNLEQRVERRGREHVHLVNDVDALFDLRRRVHRLIPQGAHAVHAVVGRGVHLRHVEERARLDAHARRAGVAGVTVLRILAVDRLGEDLGAGGLARAARAGEQVRVGEPPLGDLPPERRGDMLLSDDVGEGFGPPLAVERLIQEHTPLQIKR